MICYVCNENGNGNAKSGNFVPEKNVFSHHQLLLHCTSPNHSVESSTLIGWKLATWSFTSEHSGREWADNSAKAKQWCGQRSGEHQVVLFCSQSRTAQWTSLKICEMTETACLYFLYVITQPITLFTIDKTNIGKTKLEQAIYCQIICRQLCV